jgi:hypothetical protein
MDKAEQALEACTLEETEEAAEAEEVREEEEAEKVDLNTTLGGTPLPAMPLPPLRNLPPRLSAVRRIARPATTRCERERQ